MAFARLGAVVCTEARVNLRTPSRSPRLWQKGKAASVRALHSLARCWCVSASAHSQGTWSQHTTPLLMPASDPQHRNSRSQRDLGDLYNPVCFGQKHCPLDDIVTQLLSLKQELSSFSFGHTRTQQKSQALARRQAPLARTSTSSFEGDDQHLEKIGDVRSSG